MLSTPIINPPQSAILGMHATTVKPAVVNGQIVARWAENGFFGQLGSWLGCGAWAAQEEQPGCQPGRRSHSREATVHRSAA